VPTPLPLPLTVPTPLVPATVPTPLVPVGAGVFDPDVPTGDSMLIELYRDDDFSHYFFHALIGRSANDALSRIVAWRMKNRSGGNALVTIDDSGFLLTLRRFQELTLEDWRLCFEREGAEEDLRLALRGSELVKWQFRGVAQTGLMVPRNYPGHQRARKQMHWSTETIFRVLEAHEADHPLLEEALIVRRVLRMPERLVRPQIVEDLRVAEKCRLLGARIIDAWRA